MQGNVRLELNDSVEEIIPRLSRLPIEYQNINLEANETEIKSSDQKKSPSQKGKTAGSSLTRDAVSLAKKSLITHKMNNKSRQFLD